VINKASSGQFIHPGYVEHDGMIAESGKTLTDYIAERLDVKLHRVIAEGDFVVVQSQFNRMGKGFVLYEIFRVANDKIAEHWSVEQAIPDGVQPEDMF
jgi:predicted SnoaL-like aldol condensation-catalyzing enzyme